MFEHASNTKKQGDIGEARAVYEYTRLGWVVCTPLCDSAKYDLIIERDGEIKRVQVKTSSYSRDGKYEVHLATLGGNQSYKTSRNRKDGDYDELFVLVDSGDCWMVPADLLKRTKVTISSSKFDEFKV